MLYNLTVISVVWGSYYRNVICIARSVGVGGNWVICYLKGCNKKICPDCVWINIFHCFIFGIIAISTARVNYVCHKKITVENATVNW